MAKVLDALRASQVVKLQGDFIDVCEQPEADDRYKKGGKCRCVDVVSLE